MLFANNKVGNMQQEVGTVSLKLLWSICYKAPICHHTWDSNHEAAVFTTVLPSSM